MEGKLSSRICSLSCLKGRGLYVPPLDGMGFVAGRPIEEGRGEVVGLPRIPPCPTQPWPWPVSRHRSSLPVLKPPYWEEAQTCPFRASKDRPKSTQGGHGRRGQPLPPPAAPSSPPDGHAPSLAQDLQRRPSRSRDGESGHGCCGQEGLGWR